MKMHITKEWLMNNFDENDNDECTAGALYPPKIQCQHSRLKYGSGDWFIYCEKCSQFWQQISPHANKNQVFPDVTLEPAWTHKQKETQAALLMFGKELIEAARQVQEHEDSPIFGCEFEDAKLHLEARHQAFKDFVEGMFGI